MADKKRIFALRENCHVTKIWENHFPKGIFLAKFGSKLQNMNTFTFFQYNLEKKNLFQNGGQNKGFNIAQLYANLC